MNAKQRRKQLEKLGGWRQFAFLLALAERAFPNFALFAELTGVEHGDRFRAGLDSAWSMLEKKDHNVDPLQLLARLETVQPDPQQYDFFGVRPALDAWQLLEQALLCHVNPDRGRAVEGASLALETVVTFIEVSEGEGLDENELVKLLDRHELIHAETGFQEALLELLRSSKAPAVEVVAQLRAMAENEGVSNLGLATPERWQADMSRGDGGA